VAQDRRLPNRWSRYILLGVRGAVGGDRFHSLMSVARLTHFADEMPADDFEEEGLAPQEVGRLFQALEEIYGMRAGWELARLAGRESFQFWHHGFGSMSGLMDSTIPLLPVTFRMRLGLESILHCPERMWLLCGAVDPGARLLVHGGVPGRAVGLGAWGGEQHRQDRGGAVHGTGGSSLCLCDREARTMEEAGLRV